MLLAVLVSGINAVWGDETEVYSATFTSVANHSYTQNKTFTLSEQSWTSSVSQVASGIFYLGCNSSNASKGILGKNDTFTDEVDALKAADSQYNAPSTMHAYALKFDHAYSSVTKVNFSWSGGNNAFQVYLFGDTGSGYILLSSTNYATSGSDTSGSVEWSGSATDFKKFAIVARPGTTTTTATNKTLRAATFTIYESAAPAYTITAQSNNNTYGTVSLDGSVITGSPAAGYRYASPAYTVSPANSATVSQNGNEFSVTPSENTTVTINFEAIPTHTATFSINGNTGNTENFAEGADIIFPNAPADIDGKTFVGWVTSAIDGTTDEAPSFVTSATMGNADITYYAVFAIAEGSGEDGWIETALTDLTTLDVFVFSNGSYAIPTDDGTSNAPAATSITVAEGKITSDVADKLKWNVSGNTDDGYTFYPNGTTETWLYCNTTAISGSNNNIRVGTGDRKVWRVDNNGLLVTKDTYTARYLSLYNSQDFRGYTGTGNGAFIPKFYKLTSGTSYSAYCTSVVAAAVERPTITVASSFTFSTSVEMSCETDDATIYYTLDESEPTSESSEYTAPFSITATTTIKAIAIKGLDESGVTTVTATKQLAENTITVSGGNEQTIDLGESESELTLVATATNGATVVFTVDNENTTLTEDDDFLLDGSTVEIYTANTGVIVLKANAACDDDYAAATEVTVTVNVINSNAPGTVKNPYTVAQAIAATPGSGTSANVYIRGIVSQFYNTSIVGDGANYRYYISDDGTTTTQLLVYKGKKNSTDNFSSADDLLVGDVVTIYGGLTTFQSAPEVAAGNYLVSRVTKTASDLTLTSSDAVDLEKTSVTPYPTSTITWITSSTGAITCVSSSEAVATVTNAGVITAVGEGSATITISQAADATYKAGQISVTVSVTDNRSAVATGIDLPAAQKTLAVGNMDDFTATSTVDEGFTGTVVYTYATSDDNIVDVAKGTFSAEAPGSADITITATPTGGNASNYKQASQVVAVTVNGTNSISLDLPSKTQAYGAGAFGIVATVPSENYDGTVTAESSNENVATVAVNGTTITVTPQAVGTATITVTAGTGTYYPATASENCAVTVTDPEGSTTAPGSGVTIFNETFEDCNSSGGNDSNFATASTTKITSPNDYTDNDGWTLTNGYPAKECLKFGGSSSKGSAISPSITVESGKTYKLSFKAAPWNTEASKTMTINVTGGTINDKSSATTSSMTAGEWNDFEFDIVTNTTTLSLTIECSANRFFLDEVKITAPITSATVTTTGGYATYCYQYPLDLDGISGAKAYMVSSLDKSKKKVMLTQITGTIKGGVPFILKSDADTDDIEIPLADESDNVPEDNLLIGTLAPTFVEQTSGDYTNFAYSKSNECFIMINKNGNTVPANRAYLPINLGGSSVKALTFDFDNATGINTVQGSGFKVQDSKIYNLAGQRVDGSRLKVNGSGLKTGIYIVNGKKVLVK